MTRLLFFLLAVGVPLASANNCFSVRNGDWHSSATWIGCGGGVPGDGDSANISHAVVIEGDLGTVNNGIRTVKLSGTATLSVDGVAPHAVYFASTGSTLFTDLFGFVTCGRFINLNLNGGSAATKLTINSGDNVHGWFMADGGDVASSQCGTAGGGGTWTVSYADISNCGDVAAQVRCFEYSSRNPPATTDLLTISNNRLTGLPAGIVGARGFGYAFTFSNNYVSNAGCISRTYSAGIAYISSTVFDAGASGEFNLNENVFRNPAADCEIVAMYYYPTGRTTIRGNGILDSSASPVEMLGFNITDTLKAPFVESYTVFAARNAAPDVYASFPPVGTATNPFVLENSVYQGAGNILIRPYNHITTSAFHQTAANLTSQGVVLGLAGSDHAVLSNLMVSEADPGNLGTLIINNQDAIVEGWSMAGVRLPTSSSEAAILIGEPGYPSTNQIVRDNIVSKWAVGIAMGDPGTTFTSDFAGVGVHHNVTCGNGKNYTPSGIQNNGFDDGSQVHPSTVYGDLTGTCHMVSPYRLIQDYDAYIGGPGTLDDYFDGLAALNCPLAGTTPAVAPEAYDPARLYAYRTAGFAVKDLAFKTAGSGGGPVGAGAVYQPIRHGRRDR